MKSGRCSATHDAAISCLLFCGLRGHGGFQKTNIGRPAQDSSVRPLRQLLPEPGMMILQRHGKVHDKVFKKLREAGQGAGQPTQPRSKTNCCRVLTPRCTARAVDSPAASSGSTHFSSAIRCADGPVTLTACHSLSRREDGIISSDWMPNGRIPATSLTGGVCALSVLQTKLSIRWFVGIGDAFGEAGKCVPGLSP